MKPNPPITSEHRALAKQILEACRALAEFRRLGPGHRQASLHFDRLVTVLEAGAMAAQKLKDGDDPANWPEWNPPKRTPGYKGIFGAGQTSGFDALSWRPL